MSNMERRIVSNQEKVMIRLESNNDKLDEIMGILHDLSKKIDDMDDGMCKITQTTEE